MQKTNADKKYFLEGDLFYFRKIEKTDINENYYSWLNDSDIIRFMEIRKRPNSLNDMESYISSLESSDNCVMFAICLKETDEHIGNIKLWQIDWGNRNAKVSVVIGDKNQNGKGIASKSLGLLCDYAFSILNLHKLNADIHEENVASLKVFEKNGFVQEGKLLEDIFFEGKWSNRILVGKVSSI